MKQFMHLRFRIAVGLIRQTDSDLGSTEKWFFFLLFLFRLLISPGLNTKNN